MNLQIYSTAFQKILCKLLFFSNNYVQWRTKKYLNNLRLNYKKNIKLSKKRKRKNGQTFQMRLQYKLRKFVRFSLKKLHDHSQRKKNTINHPKQLLAKPSQSGSVVRIKLSTSSFMNLLVRQKNEKIPQKIWSR